MSGEHEAMMAALDEIEAVRKDANEGYPWQFAQEDHYATEAMVGALYESKGLPQPRRFSWARSPRAMWGAITMIRQFQNETRHKVVEGLIPMTNPVETEAKRVTLDTLLDKTLTTTLGGNLRDMFAGKHTQMRRSLVDLKEVLRAQMQPPMGTRMPSFDDMTLWPIEKLPIQFLRVQQNALAIAPFMHVCFLSSPPIFIATDDEGYLHCVDGPAARWADGFEIYVVHEEPDALEVLEGRPISIDELVAKATKALPKPEDNQ